MFEIEKGVQPTKSGRGKYPFAKMGKGDSFFVPHVNSYRIANMVRSSAKYFCAHKAAPGVKMMVLQVEGGCRCWRIE
jgi:hypothetical protein